MTSIKPEDRPKMIGLITAIVVVGCYFIFVVAPRLSGAQPTPEATPPAPVVSPAAATVATPPASSQITGSPLAAAPTTSESAESKPPPDAVHDPFTSPAAAASRLPIGPLTIVPIGPPTAAALSVVVKALPAPKVIEPIPAMSLLGVADGDSPVAVFDIGGLTVEKLPGEMVAGGFYLKAVDAEGVLLQKAGRQVRLAVGQSTQPLVPGVAPTVAPAKLAVNNTPHNY